LLMPFPLLTAAAAAASSGVSLLLAKGVCRALLPVVTGMHMLNMKPRSAQLPICSITCSRDSRTQICEPVVLLVQPVHSASRVARPSTADTRTASGAKPHPCTGYASCTARATCFCNALQMLFVMLPGTAIVVLRLLCCQAHPVQQMAQSATLPTLSIGS
jgi:hypothetical protein